MNRTAFFLLVTILLVPIALAGQDVTVNSSANNDFSESVVKSENSFSINTISDDCDELWFNKPRDERGQEKTLLCLVLEDVFIKAEHYLNDDLRMFVKNGHHAVPTKPEDLPFYYNFERSEGLEVILAALRCDFLANYHSEMQTWLRNATIEHEGADRVVALTLAYRAILKQREAVLSERIRIFKGRTSGKFE